MDINVRLEQLHALLSDNLTAVNAARAAYEAATTAISGSVTAVRIATSLADLDGHRAALDSQADILDAITTEVRVTTSVIRGARREGYAEGLEAAARRAQPPTRPDHLQAV